MSGFVLAARHLTILPLPGPRHASPSRLGPAAAWFPAVGLVIGVLLVGVDWLTTRWFPPLLGALLTVTAWKLVTGGLHLDGLADCLDGLGGRDREHRLAIMHDSRIGTFGALGLILFLMLELVAVAETAPAQRGRVLLIAPVVARAAPPMLARLLPAARPGGQGALFAAGVTPVSAVLAPVVAALVAGGALGLTGLVATAAGLLAAFGAGRFMTTRLGGLTGDVFGAVVEVAELLVLLAVIACAGVQP